MKVSLKYWQSSIALVVVAMALMGSTTAFAQNSNPGVLPPQSHPYGHTYGEWSNAWWQWALSIQTPNNPLLDTTGADCAVGQSGQVWFLAGTTGGSATRSCTIPAGKALFFPIVNFIVNNLGVPGSTACPPTTFTEAELRQQLDSFIGTVNTLEAQVDNVPIQDLPRYRAGSDNPTFSVMVPSDNLFSSLTGGACLIPAGTYDTQLSDGYYLMLAPLPVGSHTIHFKGATNTGFTTEATYHLTVR